MVFRAPFVLWKYFNVKLIQQSAVKRCFLYFTFLSLVYLYYRQHFRDKHGGTIAGEYSRKKYIIEKTRSDLSASSCAVKFNNNKRILHNLESLET